MTEWFKVTTFLLHLFMLGNCKVETDIRSTNNVNKNNISNDFLQNY